MQGHVRRANKRVAPAMPAAHMLARCHATPQPGPSLLRRLLRLLQAFPMAQALEVLVVPGQQGSPRRCSRRCRPLVVVQERVLQWLFSKQRRARPAACRLSAAAWAATLPSCFHARRPPCGAARLPVAGRCPAGSTLAPSHATHALALLPALLIMPLALPVPAVGRATKCVAALVLQAALTRASQPSATRATALRAMHA